MQFIRLENDLNPIANVQKQKTLDACQTDRMLNFNPVNKYIKMNIVHITQSETIKFQPFQCFFLFVFFCQIL